MIRRSQSGKTTMPDKDLRIPPDDKTGPLRSKLDLDALAAAANEPDKDEFAVQPSPIELTASSRLTAKPEGTPLSTSVPPWTLPQFFNGEIDLDAELAKRFPTMPVMASINFRSLGSKTGRGVATLTSSDGGASVVIDADAASHVIQMSFTYGSMLTLRFSLNDLSDMDRTRWLELMRRDQGGLAFLWGPTRWEHDYLICVSRKYLTNLYAFSPHNFDAAIRMTPEIAKKLLNWLEDFWKTPPPDEEPPKLLTW
jgi:hypothetical protein